MRIMGFHPDPRYAGGHRLSPGAGELKYLSGMGTTLKGQLLVWDGATTDFKKYKIRKDPDCPACGNGKN